MKTNCDIIRDLLPLYAEHITSEATNALVEEHLAECEACRAPANGVVVFAGDLALTGSTVVIDHGCGVRSYLYGLQELSVTRGQTVERGQAVGVLGEELTMDFKLGSKSVNPWPLFQTSGGLFWQEKG